MEQYSRRNLCQQQKQWIHQPWNAPKGILSSGNNYPAPIVDHATARQVALTSYQRLKQ